MFRREIDPHKLDIRIVRTIEMARAHPLLEAASFIYTPEIDLPGAAHYPELEKILPFYPKE